MASFFLLWVIGSSSLFDVLTVALTPPVNLMTDTTGGVQPGEAGYYLMADVETNPNLGPNDELQRTQRSFWKKLLKGTGLSDLFGDDDDIPCNNYNYNLGDGDNYVRPLVPPPPPLDQFAPLPPPFPLSPLQPFRILQPFLNRPPLGPPIGPPVTPYGSYGEGYGGYDGGFRGINNRGYGGNGGINRGGYGGNNIGGYGGNNAGGYGGNNGGGYGGNNRGGYGGKNGGGYGGNNGGGYGSNNGGGYGGNNGNVKGQGGYGGGYGQQKGDYGSNGAGSSKSGYVEKKYDGYGSSNADSSGSNSGGGYGSNNASFGGKNENNYGDAGKLDEKSGYNESGNDGSDGDTYNKESNKNKSDGSNYAYQSKDEEASTKYGKQESNDATSDGSDYREVKKSSSAYGGSGSAAGYGGSGQPQILYQPIIYVSPQMQPQSASGSINSSPGYEESQTSEPETPCQEEKGEEGGSEAEYEAPAPEAQYQTEKEQEPEIPAPAAVYYNSPVPTPVPAAPVPCSSCSPCGCQQCSIPFPILPICNQRQSCGSNCGAVQPAAATYGKEQFSSSSSGEGFGSNPNAASGGSYGSSSFGSVYSSIAPQTPSVYGQEFSKKYGESSPIRGGAFGGSSSKGCESSEASGNTLFGSGGSYNGAEYGGTLPEYGQQNASPSYGAPANYGSANQGTPCGNAGGNSYGVQSPFSALNPSSGPQMGGYGGGHMIPGITVSTIYAVYPSHGVGTYVQPFGSYGIHPAQTNIPPSYSYTAGPQPMAHVRGVQLTVADQPYRHCPELFEEYHTQLAYAKPNNALY